MARLLHCDCGYQLTLTDEEAQELTWCPRCRKVLVYPRLYRSGDRSYAKPPHAIPPEQGGDLLPKPLRVVGLLILAAIFVFLFIAALDNREPKESLPTPPTMQPKPNPRGR